MTTVLRSDPAADFREGPPSRYTVVDEGKQVVNFGPGVRWRGSDRIAIFGSVASNFSAVPDSVVLAPDVGVQPDEEQTVVDFHQRRFLAGFSVPLIDELVEGVTGGGP